MKFTAEQIAGMLEGTVEGNSSAEVSGLSKIEEGKAGTLTFLANPKYISHIYSTGASIAIVSNDFVAEQALPETLTLIRVADAYGSFAKLLEAYSQFKRPRPGIHASAVIDASVVIGENVHIGAGVVIEAGASVGNNAMIMAQSYLGEHVKIGDFTMVHPGVKVYSECVIGSNCTLHAGVIIGADGFGFAPQADNRYAKVPQIGNVVVEDRVEIGANTAIDRATLGSTIIREGVKLDNLIQVAHNVEIGKNTVIAALTGIAGSTKIGENCMIGGQVGIAGHLTIANGVKIAAQTGISASVLKENVVLQGTPAVDTMDFKKSYIIHRRLPQLLERIERLEKGQK
ncbi:MAG: UDP-3-O-(3-hydroxymyristoyl)glucosamine N-acyltransferase [Flavobacteriales bacterium]|jgi:UDP-3-O-[3-hydroxymyristoyl] glucosamine N-acyltransferase|nr:UDP-3-O-(3-hydroxymyristoyl)glucosamine N-acyltransferase [Flavobacteriales bacterium]MDP4717734.1 UDP-3-O-(3-hydroxymyristoyl)glucosamine N-acyltransferase [Flavobacteriales bacterium]MDP4731840.1 UDP-3-O-(3-hydroxymyristoyl)glucosamine N-acyltransferase [Flavobacteriales bacterium]MDP4818403.1 UDP-3-O-(3-hydroxymyristoyl)glucosamine N-acyltransferase [Flavobacteriales bacterium]MDP4951900.1 UDP-3-O-(3-hydroxymyristoyl)glucosamine N-acyltransferase [Flavobacteriales bacterium]